MRKRLLNKILNFFQHKAVVLMYHRIAEPESDVWDITVTPDNFEQQLQLLQKTKNVISINELVEDLDNKRIKKKSVVITFDDGYADNYYTARPLLEKYNLPATFFIASGNIEKNNEFWWDELEHIFLFSATLPSFFSIEIGGKLISSSLGIEVTLTDEIKIKHKLWKACDAQPPTARCRLFYEVWEQLKPLPSETQQQHIELIRNWAGSSRWARPAYVSMSKEQLKKLQGNDLFTIGAHTENHAALAFHSKEFQQFELSNNIAFLENNTTKSISVLSYPYGNYNRETLNIAADLDLKAAFTTEEILVKNQSEKYRLGRQQVKNWTAEQLDKKLSEWSSR